MAELNSIGHIRTSMSTGYYMYSDRQQGSTLPSRPIMCSKTTLQFYQVTYPSNLGNACLLVTSDLKNILEVTDETDSCYPNCRIVHIKPAPFSITSGGSFPGDIISDSMLFYISMVEDCPRYKCLIESKKFTDCVLDVYTANPAEGTKVVCHPNWKDRRSNQVFILDKRPQHTC